jgi:NAD(P)-dependent dehydrogenase (short-subunit alcohol dehydrogenase family)
VVTGGNGGIGLGIARSLRDAGAVVAVWGRDEAKIARALEELGDDGRGHVGLVCDVAIEDDVVAATTETVSRLGRLDVMVANAGGALPISFLEADLATWSDVARTNLHGTFLCFREAARRMVVAGSGGSLVAVSSMGALLAAPGMTHYSAAKAGLGGLVRSLAVELARYQIRCNVLVPGFTENSKRDAASIPADELAHSVAAIPARRWGTPADVAAAALYLADPSLTYHTGAEVVVDGGCSIQPGQLAARAATRSASH